ncbi:DUF3352 domain-containing protein [Cyanobium sp. NIES-981]|uniref:DUF3352 domain-containing protein n=1 Tax=Cyanobium sp. NIES-981 TaxID=1851505 RepID=UPI0007DE022D|nr:DUF3352 domain-containing protein [Cyanobium sp. NIES-981]SBO44863.1 conserved protein of unknown function [Cyanobium sp. NIES-981]
MRTRPFLAVVLAVTLSLLGLALTAGWLLWQRSPLQLQVQAPSLPRSARFVPRDAALGLFLQADAELPVDYARALAPTRQRRQAAEAVARLRDGAFAAAGLDYRGELAGWLGGETGVALLASEPGQPPDGWLLALQSRDGDGARRFLQRFWQTRSLAGTGLQVSSYRGMGLISGQGALVGREPVPIATALIDDDLVLLASGRGVLEQALDVSQIDELNLAADPAFRQALGRLARGAVLLHVRPAGLESWLGLPPPAPQGGAGGGIQSVVAALSPRGRQLQLEALVALAADPQESTTPSASSLDPSLDSPPDPSPASLPGPPRAWSSRLDPEHAAAFTAGLHGELHTVALLQDPAHWPAPWRALLQRSLDPDTDGPLPALLAAEDSGPLLWSRGPLGWLIATPAGDPDPTVLEPALGPLGLVTSSLDGPSHQSLQVWTHLDALPRPRRRRDATTQLAVSVAGARQVEGAQAWWGQTLAVLEERQAGGAGPRPQWRALEGLGLPGAPLQWASDGGPAQAALRRWPAWRLLAGLAGQPLETPVTGLALALEPAAGPGPGVHLVAALRYA